MNAARIFFASFKKPGQVSVVSSFLRFTFTAVQAETLLQVSAVISIYLLAVPRGSFVTASYAYSPLLADYFNSSEPLENLAGIQHELYVTSPLLLLVCVIGLLVALIGAALLVSTKVLNSK